MGRSGGGAAAAAGGARARPRARWTGRIPAKEELPLDGAVWVAKSEANGAKGVRGSAADPGPCGLVGVSEPAGCVYGRALLLCMWNELGPHVRRMRTMPVESVASENATATNDGDKTEQSLAEARRAQRMYFRDLKASQRSRDSPKDFSAAEPTASLTRGPNLGAGAAFPLGANAFTADAKWHQFDAEMEWSQQHQRHLTLMLRNIPLQYTRDMFCERLARLDFAGKYDFLYLPIDRATNQNMGYAFLNFRSPECCLHFLEAFDGVSASKCLPGFSGNRVCRVRRAEVQGRDENMRKLAQPGFSDALRMHESWQPLFFDDRGVQLSFEHLAFAEAAGSSIAGMYGAGSQELGRENGESRGGATTASKSSPSHATLEDAILLQGGGLWPGMEESFLVPSEETLLWASPPPTATPEWVAGLLAPALEGPPKNRRGKHRAAAAAFGVDPSPANDGPSLSASAPEFTPPANDGPSLNASAPEFTPPAEPAPQTISALPDAAASAPVYVPDAGVLEDTMRAMIERLFSVECISHDGELRALMDDQGWVKLSDLVALPQLRSHVSVGDVIQVARWMGESQTVEVSRDGSLCVRIKNDIVREAFPRMENTKRFRPPKDFALEGSVAIDSSKS